MIDVNSKELPKGWIKVRLKDVFIPNRPKVSPQNYPNLPFIGMEHITAHTMKLLGTEIAAKMKSNSVHFYPMDVLYGRLRPYLNKVFRPEFEGLCSAEFIVFPANQEIYSKFLQYFLNSYEFVSFSSQQNEGDRPRVSFDVIGNYCFSVPPLAEQHRIVEKIEELFSDLDKGIESLKTTQQQLKIYRQAVLKWAFEGKLTAKWREEKKHKGELKSAEDLLVQIKAEREKRDRTQLQEWHEAVKTWEANGKQGKKPGKPKKAKELLPLKKAELSELPELLEGWCWAKVGNLAYRVTVGHVGSMKSEYLRQGIPFLRSQNVRENRFDALGLTYISRAFHESLEKSKLQPGDIVIVRSGNVGTACVIPDGLEEANCSDLVIIKRTNLINSKFISYYFNSVTKTRVNDKKVGIALTHFNTQSVEEFAIPLPSLEEQDQIVQEIEFRLSICDRLEATITENLTRAEALRQSILKQAFEGKLVPQAPNDEPAEKLIERIRQEKRQQTNGKQLELEIF